MRSAQLIDSHAKALLAARAALDKQADDVLVIDMRALSDVTDYFVICTAQSAPQIAAVRDHIDAIFSRQGDSVWHTEGSPASVGRPDAAHDLQWVLLDCGDVVVHLLDPRARAFYRLEDLWADAPRMAIDRQPAL